MYLKNENLVIRDASASDIQTLCDWWSDGKLKTPVQFNKLYRSFFIKGKIYETNCTTQCLLIPL